MIKYAIFLFILLSANGCSQTYPDTGRVIADPNFSCATAPSLIEARIGLGNICRSENDLEIRLNEEGEIILYHALYILTCKDKTWTATKYETFFGHENQSHQDTTLRIRSLNLKKNIRIEALFDILKRNDIFTLPDQDSIQTHSTYYVDDGVLYSLTFKVGKKFRTYHFDNPEDYRRQFDNIKEFENYENIAAILNHAFERQPESPNLTRLGNHRPIPGPRAAAPTIFESAKAISSPPKHNPS